MTVILEALLIIDQDLSGSELISFHALQPCKLRSNNSLMTGMQNITSLNTGNRHWHQHLHLNISQ